MLVVEQKYWANFGISILFFCIQITMFIFTCSNVFIFILTLQPRKEPKLTIFFVRIFRFHPGLRIRVYIIRIRNRQKKSPSIFNDKIGVKIILTVLITSLIWSLKFNLTRSRVWCSNRINTTEIRIRIRASSKRETVSGSTTLLPSAYLAGAES